MEKGQSVRLTSPGAIYKDLLIIGGRVNEGLPGSPGDIRAYDVRTGKLRWIFHTIPHPGEPGYETWSKDSWRYNAGANNWAGHGPRRGPRHRLRADRVGGGRFLRRQPRRRQPLRQHAARARRGDRQADLALPAGAARHLGSRSAVPAEPRHRQARRADDRGGRADHQARLRVPVRSGERQAALPHRVPEVPAERRARRSRRRHPADSHQARAVLAAAADQRHADHADARRRTSGRSRSSRSSAATVRSCRCGSDSRRSSFPASTAAPNGAARRSIRRAGCITSTPTISRGPARWRPTMPGRAARRSTCATAPPATATIGRARRRRSRRSSASRERKSRAEILAVIQKGAGRMPAFTEPADLRDQRHRAVHPDRRGHAAPRRRSSRRSTRSIASPATTSSSIRTAIRRWRRRGAR